MDKEALLRRRKELRLELESINAELKSVYGIESDWKRKERIDAIILMVSERIPGHEIAVRLGLSRQALYAFCRKNEIKLSVRSPESLARQEKARQRREAILKARQEGHTFKKIAADFNIHVSYARQLYETQRRLNGREQRRTEYLQSLITNAVAQN